MELFEKILSGARIDAAEAAALENASLFDMSRLASARLRLADPSGEVGYVVFQRMRGALQVLRVSRFGGEG